MDKILQVYLKPFLLSGLVSLALTPFYIAFARKRGVVDKPGRRKVHRKTMPTAGGIVIWAAFLVGILFAFNAAPLFMEPFVDRFAGLALGGFIIVLVGLYDDIKGIRPKGKLAGQVLAACALMGYGFIIENLGDPFGDGKLALGMPLPTPTLVPWQREGRGGWRPAASIRLFQASFR